MRGGNPRAQPASALAGPQEPSMPLPRRTLEEREAQFREARQRERLQEAERFAETVENERARLEARPDRGRVNVEERRLNELPLDARRATAPDGFAIPKRERMT